MKNALSIIILSFFLFGCSSKTFNLKWTKEIAPEQYVSRFETTKGNFDVMVTRKLSPKATDRFYQLVKHKFFDNGIFYRVNPGFVAQFGGNDKTMYKHWENIPVPDEKVIQGNLKGALSFARGGKQTRTTDLFINLKKNTRLDTLNYNDVKGFPSFGEVTAGMNVVENLYSGYADTTMQDFELMLNTKDRFLKKYPKLDQIKKAYIVKD